jgi:hypothetical protein
MTHPADGAEQSSSEQINIRERYETQLWMQALDIDEGTLRRAVSEAGTRVDNVRKYLAELSKAAKRPAKTVRPATRSAVRTVVRATASRSTSRTARRAKTATRARTR